MEEIERSFISNPFFTTKAAANGMYSVNGGVLLMPDVNPSLAKLDPPITEQTSTTIGNIFESTKNASEAEKALWRNILSEGNFPSSYKNTYNKLLEKYSSGTEAYLLTVPVLRMTTRSSRLPQTIKGGFISTPPTEFGDIVRQFQWLKCSSSSTREGKYGKWTHVQQWKGADSWDADLYKK